MASEVLLDKDVLSQSQLRATSMPGSEIDYRNFLAGIKPRVKAGNVTSEILTSANLRPSSSIVLDSLETSIVAEQRALFPIKPTNIRDLNYPPSNIRPALADTVSDRETRKQTEVSSAKHTSMHKSKNLDLDSLKRPSQKSKPPSVNQLRSLFDQEKDFSTTESVQSKLMKVAHPSTSLSTSFEGDELRIKLPVLGIHHVPSAKTKSAEINSSKWAVMKLEDQTKIEESERGSHAVVKSAQVSTKPSDIIHHAGQRGQDSSFSELEEVNGEIHHRVPESSKKGMHGILARKTSEFDKIEENIVIRGSTKIDVSSILVTADENHNILYEIPSKEAQEFAESSSEISQKSENEETQNLKLIEKEENIIIIGDKIIKRRSLAERLNAIVNGEESFLFSSPDYVFLTDNTDSNNFGPRNLPLKSSKSYNVCIEKPFVLDVPNNTSEHALSVTSASNLTWASENPQVQNQPNGIDDSVNEMSTIEKHDNSISREPYISKAHAIKEEVPPAYQSLCSTREVKPVIQNELRPDETVRHAKAISEKLLTGSELVKAMAGENICEVKNYGLMGPDTELRANEFLNPEKEFEDHVSDSEVGYFEAAPDKPVGETDSKQELGVESPTAANASLLARMLIDLPGSSASDFLPSKHSNVSPKVSDASTASLQSIDSGEDFYLPPPPEKSALRKTSHEERRNVNFADATKEVILTYSPWEYDRANLEIDPVAASAEWELEKRVESMDVFSVDLNKDERGLGLSIIGLGVGSDTGLEKLGIFVKTLTPNGAAERDGRIQVNDQILEVNGVSLVGVTQQFAAFTLKGASGTVRFLMGREKSRRHYFSPGSTGSNSDIGVLEQKHNEELNEVIMQLQEMEERALVAENTLDEVKYALLQAEERAHSSDDQVKELQEKMAAMAEQHSKDKDDEIDELRRSLQDITVRLTASEENVLAMQVAAEEKEDGIVELERKLRLAEDNLRQIEERNVVLTQEVKDRESQLAEMEKKIETHHVDYSDMIEQLDTYKERYQRLAKELDTIRAEASEDLLEKFALLEEANCSFGKEIVDLKSVNERLERQVVERDELVKKLNAENEYLQKLIVKLERSDVKATPSVEALTIRNVEQEVKIKQLEEKILFLEREKSAATRRRFFGELSPVVPEGSSSVRARSDDVDECEPLSGDSGVTDDSFERPAVPKRQLIREELSDGIVPSARVEPEVSLPPEISRGNKPHPSLEIALRVSASKPENCADASRAVSPGVAASVSALAPVARGAELLTSRLAEVEEDHHYLSLVDSLEQASESGSSVFLEEETPQTSQSTSTHNHVAESAEHDDGDFGVVPYVEEREDEDDWAIVRLEDAVNVANPVPKPPRHHFVGAESKALPVSHVLDNELKVNRSIMEESVSESSVSIASVTSASLSTSEASLDAVRINYDLTVPSTPKPIVEAFRAAPFSSSEPGAVGTVDRNATVAPSDHSEQPEMPTTLPSIRRGYDEQVRKSPALSFLSTLPETKVDSESEDDGRFGRGEASAPGLAVKEYGALESPKKVSDVHTWLHEDWGRLADDEREGHADEIAARIASRSPVLRKGSLASSSSSDDEKKTPTADLADEQDDDGDSRDVRWAQSMKLDESYFAKSKVVLTDSFDDALQSHSDVDVAAKKGSGYHFEFDSVMPKTPILDSKVFRERGDVREDKWKPSEHILAGESDSFQLLGDDGAGPQAAQFLAKPTVDGSTRGSAQSVGKDGDKHEKHKRFSIHLPKVFRKNSKSTKRSSSELASSVSSHFPSVVEVNVDRAASDAGSGDTHSGSDEDVVPFDEKAAASRSLERLNSAAFEDAHAPCANKEALMSAHTSHPQPSKSAPQATKLRAARSNTLDSKTSRLAAEAELKAAVSSPDLSHEPPSPSLAATAAFSRSTNAIAAGVKEDAADVHISNGTEGTDQVTHWTGKPANDWDVRQVGLWLVEINMGQYVNAFKAANIDGHALVRLDGNKLKDLGVADQSHRSEIKMHAKRYRHNASDDPHGKVAKRGRKLKFWKGKYAAN